MNDEGQNAAASGGPKGTLRSRIQGFTVRRNIDLTRAYIASWFDLARGDCSAVPRNTAMCLRWYPRWLRLVHADAQRLSECVAWMPFPAWAFVDSVLRPHFTVFEYGSGGSTLLYSKRVSKLVSVEHDAQWFAYVRDALVKDSITNCEYLFIPPEPGNESQTRPDDPRSYSSSSRHYQGFDFSRYASSIDRFPDEFFDLVVVDGRARPSCVRHACSKVRLGGYLLLDDSQRNHYRSAISMLSNWERHRFLGPGPYAPYFWETTIWRRTQT